MNGKHISLDNGAFFVRYKRCCFCGDSRENLKGCHILAVRGKRRGTKEIARRYSSCIMELCGKLWKIQEDYYE